MLAGMDHDDPRRHVGLRTHTARSFRVEMYGHGSKGDPVQPRIDDQIHATQQSLAQLATESDALRYELDHILGQSVVEESTAHKVQKRLGELTATEDLYRQRLVILEAQLPDQARCDAQERVASLLPEVRELEAQLTAQRQELEARWTQVVTLLATIRQASLLQQYAECCDELAVLVLEHHLDCNQPLPNATTLPRPSLPIATNALGVELEPTRLSFRGSVLRSTQWQYRRQQLRTLERAHKEDVEAQHARDQRVAAS